MIARALPRSARRACGAAWVFLGALAFATGGIAQPLPEAGAIGGPAAMGAPVVNPQAPPTAAQLDQLVAPIALYPDALVAQILAAATFPTEVVEADRWMRQHPGLKGADLAQAVDLLPWDPSVKALTQFPSVLASMNRNLAWTAALGDAYASRPADVLDTVQAMRRSAMRAGSLPSNGMQTVAVQGESIVIQPAAPGVVYVPVYDPWIVYGAPIVPYPGWIAVPGLHVAYPGIHFGLGISVGVFAGFGWGWSAWGFDWHRHAVVYAHEVYVPHGHGFVRRADHGGVERGFEPRGGLESGGAGHEFEGRGGLGAGGGVEHGLEHRGGVERGAFEHHDRGSHRAG